MATDLQSTLEGLQAELDRAGERLQASRSQAQAAEAAVQALRHRVQAESARIGPAAAALQARLESGRTDVEAAHGRLEGDLKALDGEVRERTRATHERVGRMLESVRHLRATLARLQQGLQAEAAATATAVAAATEEAATALAGARRGLGALDGFVRQEFVPRLAAHEAAAQSDGERLTATVRDRVLPTVESHVAHLQKLLLQAGEELRRRAAELGADARTRTDGAVTSLESTARQAGEEVARRTADSAAWLADSVEFVQERLHAEEVRQVALLAAASTAVPHLEDLEEIPRRLQETLRKARVIQ